jgi:hypothetical protein
MPELEERYRKDPSMLARDIAGEVILVPIRRSAGELEAIYTLNETGARIWKLLDDEHTLAEISDQIQAEFEVSPEQACQDLFDLLARLQEINAIVKV